MRWHRVGAAGAVLVAAVVIAVRQHTEHSRGTRQRAAADLTADGAPSRGADPSPLEPGQLLTVELHSAPATSIAPRVELDDTDTGYRDIVAGLGQGGLIYDPLLSRAARELAVQVAVVGETPPPDVLTFVLRSAGAPESAAGVTVLSTTQSGDDALIEAAHGALAVGERRARTVRMGMGEAATPGDPFARRIVVLVSHREYELEPAPRHVEVSGAWTVRGELPADTRDPVASVLLPGGDVSTHPVATRGRRFELTLAMGDTSGAVSVSIDATGADGPAKLMQLVVHVGEPVPRSIDVVVPEREPGFASIEDAEQYAFDRLAEDRIVLGAPQLELDAELSRVARAHSEEMRDLGTFGHQSARTGLAADRLAAAGYRAVSHAENLARNSTLAEAQRSLVDSVSHRVNIANPAFSRVGIGLARGAGSSPAWYLTQLFAAPVVELSDRDGAARMLERIEEVSARDEPAEVDARLAAIAGDGARRAAAGETEGLAERIADGITHVRGRISVSVQVVYGLDGAEIPDPVRAEDVTSIGVGVHQLEDDAHGRTGVVIIVVR